MLRRITNFTVWMLLLLAAIGGIGTIGRMFSLHQVETKIEPDFSAAQGLAEQVVRIYFTFDENDFAKRQQALNLLYPSLEVSSTQPKGASQTVDQVSALKPIATDNSRIKVPVDTWLTIRTKEKSVVRHVRVTVMVYQDAKGAVAVDGLPMIETAEFASIPSSQAVLKPVSDEEQRVIKPVLQSFLNEYFQAKDPIALQNMLSASTQVNPLAGFFQFDSILSANIVQIGPDTYSADVTVKAFDPLLSTKIPVRVKVNLVKQQGRYLISGVNH